MAIRWGKAQTIVRKAPKKRYVIVAENGNFLGYISYRMEGQSCKINVLWFMDEEKAIKFDSLKFANCLINESDFKGCHIEEV